MFIHTRNLSTDRRAIIHNKPEINMHVSFSYDCKKGRRTIICVIKEYSNGVYNGICVDESVENFPRCPGVPHIDNNQKNIMRIFDARSWKFTDVTITQLENGYCIKSSDSSLPVLVTSFVQEQRHDL